MKPTAIRPRTVTTLHVLLLAALLLGAATAAQAQMTFYASRAGFDAAVPVTTLVDFEAGVLVGPDFDASFPGPLNSTTNNGVFSPGDIPAGIEFANSSANNLVLVGPGFVGWGPAGGFTSKVLFPSNDVSSLVISFPTPVDAVAFDAYSERDSGFTVTVYGLNDAVLQIVDDAAGSDSPGFFGVRSQVPITRVVLNAPVDGDGNWEAADNVAFRAFAPPDPVPTLGRGSLALLTLLLAAGGLVALRRALA